MNILLTGATGFLGAHLVPALTQAGHSVIILRRMSSSLRHIEGLPLTDYSLETVSLDSIFQRHTIDCVIHLATDYGRRQNSDVSQLIAANIALPARLLEACSRSRCPFFINTHTDSPSMYTAYSATKHAFKELIRYFTGNSTLRCVTMTLEYMYGEKDDTSKFIPAVITDMLQGHEIKLTSGEQRRDFIYVGDVVAAYMRLLCQLPRVTEPAMEFPVGTGSAVSIKECVFLIESILGIKANLRWGSIPYRKNELFFAQADITHTSAFLDWQPRMLLADGLRRTISWYKQGYDNGA
ncbi:MAG: NAD(P)-dependent oxidoreductase [Candidatus Omnitrophica bacterium]|nr:NAD(P)-dependent oxidoreductase [Candidatus Omnitrophota bacterium]